MRTSNLLAALVMSTGLLLAANLACRAANIDLITGGNFHTAANWSNNMVPTLSANTYYLQNGLTATFASGSTSLRGLVVGNDSFGFLSMTGGSLTLLDNNMLELGRERFPNGRGGDYNNNGIVDAADYTVWRDTLGQPVLNGGDGADGDESESINQGDYDFWKARFGHVTRGGNLVLPGNSVKTNNGAFVGRSATALI